MKTDGERCCPKCLYENGNCANAGCRWCHSQPSGELKLAAFCPNGVRCRGACNYQSHGSSALDAPTNSEGVKCKKHGVVHKNGGYPSCPTPLGDSGEGQKKSIKECAEKICYLTGHGMALHTNDIIPDLEELLSSSLQAEQERVRGVIAAIPKKLPDDGYGDEDAYNAGYNAALTDLQEKLADTPRAPLGNA